MTDCAPFTCFRRPLSEEVLLSRHGVGLAIHAMGACFKSRPSASPATKRTTFADAVKGVPSVRLRTSVQWCILYLWRGLRNSRCQQGQAVNPGRAWHFEIVGRDQQACSSASML